MTKVIDLFDDDLDKACIKLSEKITENIDLVIGIAEGGRYVATQVANAVNLPVLFIKKQRVLTNKKSKFKNFLPFFPKIVLNTFRIIESKIYEMRFDNNWEDDSDNVEFVSDNVSDLFNKKIHSILLVDDSIDSGKTMKDCVRFLMKQRSDINVKIAVLTQTFKNPLIEADYKIYNRILIRYPWSSDVGIRKTNKRSQKE